jgi:endonuclease G
MDPRPRAPVFALFLSVFLPACGAARGGEAEGAPDLGAYEVPRLDAPDLELEARKKKLAASSQTALGVPVDDDASDDYVMDKGEYVVSYNHERNVPNWVSWKIDASDLGSTDRASSFEEDDSLPSSFLRVTSKDYERTGWDRGHMCPSGDRTRSVRTNTLTFLLTNVVPQAPASNRGPWKVFEEYSRSLVRSGDATAYVVAGPVFSGSSDPTIGRGVAVPAYTFKVLVTTTQGAGAAGVTKTTTPMALLVPNDSSVGSDWADYLVSVDDVEAATGYDFLTALSTTVQDAIEGKTATH